jgi:hypothetical protein
MIENSVSAGKEPLTRGDGSWLPLYELSLVGVLVLEADYRSVIGSPLGAGVNQSKSS